MDQRQEASAPGLPGPTREAPKVVHEEHCLDGEPKRLVVQAKQLDGEA